LTDAQLTDGQPTLNSPANELPTQATAPLTTQTISPRTAKAESTPYRAHPRWPLALIAAPAAVSTWSGWVGLGELAGFGAVRPLPGIADNIIVNTAVTLPIGVEAYAAYALHAWLSPASHHLSPPTRRFAAASAIGSLGLGMLGQVAYHQLTLAHAATAPGWVVTVVSCLPVLVLGMSAALLHMIRRDRHTTPHITSQPAAQVGPARTPHDTADRTAVVDRMEPAPVRAHDPAPPRRARVTSLVPKDELIADLVAQILTAAEAGHTWRPDYEVLRRRTGLSRSWCEKRVHEARIAAGHIVQDGDYTDHLAGEWSSERHPASVLDAR
jgi:hypothetical protein